jgi:vacuolar protein sorting-associated protein VTA1
MPPLAIPDELKKISQYIKRAEELDKDQTAAESRLVAYYLRQYAVHLGIPLAGASPGAKACLGQILGALETEKTAMNNFSRDESAFLCRKFAEGIFNKADAEDRAGQANKGTAKTFYATASFLQMLEQFADVEEREHVEEDKKRIVYCKWKATEILKALREGRTPTPGGYGEDEVAGGLEMAMDDKNDEVVETTDAPAVETVLDEPEDDDFGLPPAPVSTLPPPVLPPRPMPEDEADEDYDEVEDQGTEVKLGPPPAYPGGSDNEPEDKPSAALSFNLPSEDLPAPAKKSAKLFGFGSKKNSGATKASSKELSKAQIMDATELTRFALSALEDRDVELAVDRLQQALASLTR